MAGEGDPAEHSQAGLQTSHHRVRTPNFHFILWDSAFSLVWNNSNDALIAFIYRSLWFIVYLKVLLSNQTAVRAVSYSDSSSVRWTQDSSVLFVKCSMLIYAWELYALIKFISVLYTYRDHLEKCGTIIRLHHVSCLILSWFFLFTSSEFLKAVYLLLTAETYRYYMWFFFNYKCLHMLRYWNRSIQTKNYSDKYVFELLGVHFMSFDFWSSLL